MTIGVLEADEIFRAHGMEPLGPHVLANLPRKAICAQGHVTFPTLVNLRRRPNGTCGECAHAVRGAKRKLSADEAARRLESSGFIPLEPYVRSDLPWLMECQTCGDRSNRLLEKIQQGVGCVACFEKRRGLSRRVAPEDAFRVMAAGRYRPLVSYPTSGKPWTSVCMDCGETRSPSYDNVKQGMKCPCHSTGFSLVKPTEVYLIAHAGFNALKVGVSQAIRTRVKPYRREGFDIRSMHRFDAGSGRNALRVEEEVIATWRVNGFPGALPSTIVGYTESVSLLQVPLCDATRFLTERLPLKAVGI